MTTCPNPCSPEGTPPAWCGTVNGYTNRKCRGELCRLAWKADTKIKREKKMAQRVEIDGRLVSTWITPENHGKESTYRNHGCRCQQCTDAATAGQSARSRPSTESGA